MKVIVLLILTCELCWTIRVPVSWNDGESVQQDSESDEESNERYTQDEIKSEDSREVIRPKYETEQIKPPVPVEYFEYTAKKPKFAVDVAAFHGVQSPENHYKAYPIRPHTGMVKPELGKHQIFDNRNPLYKPFQDYTKINKDVNQTNPVSSSFEVFHPYEAETPALQEIYRDPVLNKIRNDLENSRSRLQQYEKDAGEPNISKDEYLESTQRTDDKLFPQKHRPAPFEIHRPQRRPVYYRPIPLYNNREHYLNQKLRSPWNHNIAKVRPAHYRPIQNHIHNLRQHHALKYDDERNEYPQVQIYEDNSDPKEGHDIYERGKDKFLQLRDNVDESINTAVKENHPPTYQKLEIQGNDSASDEDDDEEDDEYVPIKNYAQVRRTETFRHLPRSAALEDAETLDEIKNSPRLREAVKSTKAQTVYSEEGYEDAAYDHAGEQKHASENEGHGGFLKEHELSAGKYKTPSVNAEYNDGDGLVFRDQKIHAEKWKDDNKDTKEETDEEDYADDEHEHLLEADNFQTEPQEEDSHRKKRENNLKPDKLSNVDVQSNITEDTQHKVDKQVVNFEVPHIDLSTTFFKDNQFSKLAKLKLVPKKDTLKHKYPYYFKNLKSISKNSPLRYAENLKLIPQKTNGGTEFYDSRSKFECPEVDDVPDPIPEKLKGEGHPDEDDGQSEQLSSAKGDENFDTTKKQPRLKGLGDKIDCFKAKYFGENPLDSPFFKEDIISKPEPVFLPNIETYKLRTPLVIKHKEEKAEESNTHNVFSNLHENNTSGLFDLIDKLRNEQNLFKNFNTNSTNDSLVLETSNNPEKPNATNLAAQSNVYNDVLTNIKNSLLAPKIYINNVTHHHHSLVVTTEKPSNNITYTHFQHKEDITKSPLSRKKRAAPFLYEPYKIIRDSQIQEDLKKTTITSNVSPIIKQLQSSRVIDTVDKQHSKDIQHIKRNVNSRAYKDIGQKDREIKLSDSSKNDKNFEDPEIVDVSLDKRRGEPRYEIRHENHKSRYTPVTNQKSMTKRDYEAQINNDEVSPTSKTRGESKSMRSVKQRKTTEKPYFDVSKFIPRRVEFQSTTESFISTGTGSVPKEKSVRSRPSYVNEKKLNIYNESNEDYEEYDDDEKDKNEERSEILKTTTTTTIKPVFRRKLRAQTTTPDPHGVLEEPILKLVTRFRDFKPQNQQNNRSHFKQNEKYVEQPEEQISNQKNSKSESSPTIREKKKKVSKSTIVTDTKRYGDVIEDKEQMMKDEVDALIGVKHDMDDYVPLYETEAEKKLYTKPSETKISGEDVDDSDEEDDDREADEDKTLEEDEEDDEEDEDNDDEEIDDEYTNDGESDNESASASEEENLKVYEDPHVTTPEPTKRTLVITTVAPVPTIATRSAKLQARPIVTRKKIEIHKELPVNKSSPHISQFKQDIKEIEIIKETRNPLRREPNKNVEVFDLYKDDNLAKDINKLGVEVFKENLNLRQGPKHGGNYRSIEPSTIVPHQKVQRSKEDAETSQSEFKKNVEVDDEKSKSQAIRNRSGNSKLIELANAPDRRMHGGNLRYRGRSQRNNDKSQKLIELDDGHDVDSSDALIEEKSNINTRQRHLHGGNYQSAQLTKEKPSTESAKILARDTRQNAALVLNSFVQAVPVLTTKPTYILDPSQRKYYYVDD